MALSVHFDREAPARRILEYLQRKGSGTIKELEEYLGVTTTAVVIDQDGLLRYRGQFADGKKQLAHDALKSVLAGKEVAVEETRQKG